MGRFLPVSTYVFDLEEFTGMEALSSCRLYTHIVHYLISRKEKPRSRTNSSVVIKYLISSVPDPNPDPHVFEPPGSGYIRQRYGSGSGSFYHQAKIVRTLFLLFCDFFGLFIVKNDVNVPSKVISRKTFYKNSFLLTL
jgi:hypothetical protein